MVVLLLASSTLSSEERCRLPTASGARLCWTWTTRSGCYAGINLDRYRPGQCQGRGDDYQGAELCYSTPPLSLSIGPGSEQSKVAKVSVRAGFLGSLRLGWRCHHVTIGLGLVLEVAADTAPRLALAVALAEGNGVGVPLARLGAPRATVIIVVVVVVIVEAQGVLREGIKSEPRDTYVMLYTNLCLVCARVSCPLPFSSPFPFRFFPEAPPFPFLFPRAFPCRGLRRRPC